MEFGFRLYDDVSMAALPQTIAFMGRSFMMGELNQGHKRKAAEFSSSSSGSGGESSADGKKLQDRERNRLQARKSRNLKKKCTEQLQNQLQKLEQEVEAVQARDKEAEKKKADGRDGWCRVLRKVFDLRAESCTDEEKWLEVISSDLRLIMPITPYRSFNPTDVVNNRRVLLGVDGMIADTQSLKVTCDNIGVKTRGQEGPVSVHYSLGTDKAEAADVDDENNDDDSKEPVSTSQAYFNHDGIMCSFKMRTLDAVAHGARSECEKNGMIRARFNVENKIEELEVTFDAIAFYHQLMLANGREDFPVVPNTLDVALKDQKSRIVVTTARRPFRITHVNKAWTDLCGFELEECQGKSLSILQGPETDMTKVADLCKLTQKGYAASMVVTNHNKKGELFRNHLRCYPVSSDEPGEISHIVGVLASIPNDKEGQRGGGVNLSKMSAGIKAF